ncbi:MAG: valine--tRNA ligase [Cardiobacteriaceae bacterium]|nr:valine--tRNA ligase [Cardiobacteriaceae bacterium]
MSEMASRYAPQEIENKWYENWDKKGYFAPSGEGAPYAIMIPPPNVTGTLHMGHAFQDTIMDTLIRYQRMNGKKALWQVGTDHAGIATQMVVERQLNAQGQTRHDLGREKFVEKVWDWKALSGGQILQQLRRLGASVDWSRERFTMDEDLSEAVRLMFVKLYEDGLIYRGKRLVNWDPVLKTALSDLEVINDKEEDGFLYHVRYPFVAGQGLDGEYMHIATTRPETILADGALAIHPEDERYVHLVGKMVHVPLTDRIIPIIADTYVEKDFGTGCVKITPAHDFNDFQVGQRHAMEVINLMNDDASLNENAPPAYRGLDRWDARKKIIEDLKSASLLEKVEPHKLKPPRGDRTGVVLEPYLTDQWFVDLTSEHGQKRLTQPAIEAVRSERVKFVPKNWENTYFQWLENIQDWCISRQLWWGHRIPAWYDSEGNIYVAENEAKVREKYQLSAEKALFQDEDVLDTWFSSALWCFATQGWPKQTLDLATYYPSSVLVTGFDIIFFWVARMILFSQYAMGDVPFREVYVHGLVRDSEGQKMSKSKGNVLDPIDIIDGIGLEALLEKRTFGMMQPEKADKIRKQTAKEFPEGINAYGTDALRFTFTALATNGRDLIFDLNRVEGYRNFCNKLWNASRFVLMQTQDKTIQSASLKDKSVIDRWIYAKLDETIIQVKKAIEEYRFDFASQALYEFIWNEYCDWYLELTKPVLSKNNPNENEKALCRHTLLDILEQVLRLAHPIMPFITEEIWQSLREHFGAVLDLKTESIMIAPYPQALNIQENQAIAEVDWLKEVLLGIRKIRGEMNISPSKALPVLVKDLEPEDLIITHQSALLALGKLENIQILAGNEPDAAAFMVGKAKFMIPLAGIIDKAAELARLQKELEKLEKNIAKLTAQLANEKFVQSAPEHLVAQTRAILEKDQQTQSALLEQREKIAAL